MLQCSILLFKMFIGYKKAVYSAGNIAVYFAVCTKQYAIVVFYYEHSQCAFDFGLVSLYPFHKCQNNVNWFILLLFTKGGTLSLCPERKQLILFRPQQIKRLSVPLKI